MEHLARKKILISAYACLPHMGSEPGMGWNWVSRICKHHDVWLLTEENRYAPVIKKYILDNPEMQGHLNVVGIPRERYGEQVWSHIYYWSYRKWQKLAYQKAIELHRDITFDIVHQLNMIGYREPGYLWRLPVPFVWGPVGGHAQMPWAFIRSLGIKGGLHYTVRNLLNSLQMRWHPRVKKAAISASILIAATKEDQLAFEKIYMLKSTLLNEQGTNPELFLSEFSQPTEPNNEVLRIVWCGLFVPRKALPLALYAIKIAAKQGKLELHILGSGICEQEWKGLAKKLEIEEICHWYGNIEHARVLKIMKNSDVLLFTSLQEGTPAVVTEAIQMGLPVICHNMCGFGSIVNNNCGIKIKPKNPEYSIQGFSTALIKLVCDKRYLLHLKNGALEQSKNISWENKIKIMLEYYKKALSVK